MEKTQAYLVDHRTITWAATSKKPGLAALPIAASRRREGSAIEKLVELAKREGVELRQSYLRLAKRAAIMVGRYTHAHQFKRARWQPSAACRVSSSPIRPRSPSSRP